MRGNLFQRKKVPPHFYFYLVFLSNSRNQLCNLHYHEGNEDEAKGDQVHMRGQSLHAKREAYGCEEHKGNEGDGRQGCEVERAVGEYTDLEERVFASHIVCLNDLAESEDCKCHGATLRE